MTKQVGLLAILYTLTAASLTTMVLGWLCGEAWVGGAGFLAAASGAAMVVRARRQIREWEGSDDK